MLLFVYIVAFLIYKRGIMKRISLIVLVCLLAVPSATMAAQAAAPANDAPISTWTSWFKSLRRPTRADALRAQQFVRSKWRCMVRGQGCSATERNSLRALAGAAAAAVAGAVGYGVKRYRDQQESEAQWQAKVRAAQAAREQGRPARDREVALRQMIFELKQDGTTVVQPQAIFRERGRPLTVNPWRTSAGVAEGAIWKGDIDLLRRLIEEGAVNLKENNVDLSHVLDHKHKFSPGNSVAFMKVIVDAPGVDSEYLSQKFGERPERTLLFQDISEYPNPAFVELLLDAGIDPTTAGLGDKDALISAAGAFNYARNAWEYRNVLDTIRLLIQHQSNPNATRYDGKSVREVAREALEGALAKRGHYPRSQDDVEKAMREVETALTSTGRTIKPARQKG